MQTEERHYRVRALDAEETTLAESVGRFTLRQRGRELWTLSLVSADLPITRSGIAQEIRIEIDGVGPFTAKPAKPEAVMFGCFIEVSPITISLRHCPPQWITTLGRAYPQLSMSTLDLERIENAPVLFSSVYHRSVVLTQEYLCACDR